MASLLILLHPSKSRHFKLRHDLEISSIVISVIRQKLRSSCWSFGQEQITLQIDVSEYSLRLEIFRYSNLWHNFTILHRPLPSTSRVQKLLKPPGRSMHRLRYFRFEYELAISSNALLLNAMLFMKLKWVIFGHECTMLMIFLSESEW